MTNKILIVNDTPEAIEALVKNIIIVKGNTNDRTDIKCLTAVTYKSNKKIKKIKNWKCKPY